MSLSIGASPATFATTYEEDKTSDTEVAPIHYLYSDKVREVCLFEGAVYELSLIAPNAQNAPDTRSNVRIIKHPKVLAESDEEAVRETLLSIPEKEVEIQTVSDSYARILGQALTAWVSNKTISHIGFDKTSAKAIEIFFENFTPDQSTNVLFSRHGLSAKADLAYDSKTCTHNSGRTRRN